MTETRANLSGGYRPAFEEFHYGFVSSASLEDQSHLRSSRKDHLEPVKALSCEKSDEGIEIVDQRREEYARKRRKHSAVLMNHITLFRQARSAYCSMGACGGPVGCVERLVAQKVSNIKYGILRSPHRTRGHAEYATTPASSDAIILGIKNEGSVVFVGSYLS